MDYQYHPLSGRDIERLEIPDSFDGKKVIRLGNEHDDDIIDDGNVEDIFGIYDNEDYRSPHLCPKKKVRTVNKIKHIILPDHVKEMTVMAFDHVQDGKTIYIPAGLKQNVIKLTKIQWKSFDISTDNKWFGVKNQCLLSKSGNKLYGYVGTETKVKIPDGVKYIAERAFLLENVEEIFIPKSVKRIGSEAFRVCGSTTPVIKLSKKNKYFEMEHNCIYNKKTGRLVVAYDENGIITVPEGVTYVKDIISYSGNEVKKIIFPKTFKKICDHYWNVYLFADNSLQVVFLSPIPPEEISDLPDTAIYVPRGSKERYESAILDAGLELKNWYKDGQIGNPPKPKRVVIEMESLSGAAEKPGQQCRKTKQQVFEVRTEIKTKAAEIVAEACRNVKELLKSK